MFSRANFQFSRLKAFEASINSLEHDSSASNSSLNECIACSISHFCPRHNCILLPRCFKSLQCIFQLFFSRLRPLQLVLLRASCLVVSTDMHCRIVSDLEQLFQWQCVLHFRHRSFSSSQNIAPFLSTISSIDSHLIRRDQDFPWSLWLLVLLHRHPNCQRLLGETAVRFQTATQ